MTQDQLEAVVRRKVAQLEQKPAANTFTDVADFCARHRLSPAAVARLLPAGILDRMRADSASYSPPNHRQDATRISARLMPDIDPDDNPDYHDREDLPEGYDDPA